MSMFGNGENVDASVGDVVLGGDVERLEIKWWVDDSWADDVVGEIEDGVEDDGLMQTAGWRGKLEQFMCCGQSSLSAK